MKPNNVIANLNREVKYVGNEHPELKGRWFIFLGATIRRKPDRLGERGKPFYQAEVMEKENRALYIFNLSDIELFEE